MIVYVTISFPTDDGLMEIARLPVEIGDGWYIQELRCDWILNREGKGGNVLGQASGPRFRFTPEDRDLISYRVIREG